MDGEPERSRQGILLVISAPSGTGKSTLINRLRVEFPRLAFSVSYTTRAPRAGELNGREYHFVDSETFNGLRDSGKLAEWAEVHGNFYGTSRPAVQAMLDQGRDVLFDIDVQGSRQLRQAFAQGAFIFLFPPSMRVLEQRLRGRGTETEESLAKRMANARRELEQADFFDYWIVNDDLDRAYQNLRGVYQAEGLRKSCNPGLVEQILAG
ncbi:guanylate kinase [Desulfonatronum sp. SC1]|uniref:guanylate kinase n=1 Tax=Desulfonatronum sp. SC1 TaxID=2109626 RepID=UPI000D3207AE|nr:guanylate kinase [Desulfonatronum sp. SC1]PTN36088.1 guanylate kinase [Desulfonatronum sp. SC1]